MMNTQLLNKKFGAIGARIKIANQPPRRLWASRQSANMLTLDIGTDRRGEYFEIYPAADCEVEVIDADRKGRHLLLLVREEGQKNKYLCGHDERHWFVAGIPESASVGTVRQAKEALQPVEVQAAVAREGLSSAVRNRRKNTAFIRQGEWFFLPVADFNVPEKLVRKNEPLRRGQTGKPHWAEFCYRTGGETVYVCDRYPGGLLELQYRKVISGNARAATWGWQLMRRNPGVFVRGRVRHVDHATIELRGWHRVVMNTENESRAMMHVAFLD